MSYRLVQHGSGRSHEAGITGRTYALRLRTGCEILVAAGDQSSDRRILGGAVADRDVRAVGGIPGTRVVVPRTVEQVRVVGRLAGESNTLDVVGEVQRTRRQLDLA